MVVLQVPLAVRLVEIDLLQLGRRREDDVGKPGRIGHELLVDKGEEVVTEHALHDEARIGTGTDRIRGEDVEAHDRGVGYLARQPPLQGGSY